MQFSAVGSRSDLKKQACDSAMSRRISNVLPSNLSELIQI